MVAIRIPTINVSLSISRLSQALDPVSEINS